VAQRQDWRNGEPKDFPQALFPDNDQSWRGKNSCHLNKNTKITIEICENISDLKI
jgi:hypothetical protein